MVKIETVKQLALTLPETDTHPHFDRLAFRVRKKIFATLDEHNKRVMVKLPLNEQSVFCLIDPAIIYPVPGGWGAKGATYIELGKVKKALLKEALLTAYRNVAPAALTDRKKKK